MSLQTQPLVAEGYQLDLHLSRSLLRIEMKGTFDMDAAAALSSFFVSVEADVRKHEVDTIIINAAELYYLGSSCIKTLITLVTKLKTHAAFPQLRVLVNPRLDWHERTFAVLGRLAPRQVSIEKAT